MTPTEMRALKQELFFEGIKLGKWLDVLSEVEQAATTGLLDPETVCEFFRRLVDVDVLVTDYLTERHQHYIYGYADGGCTVGKTTRIHVTGITSGYEVDIRRVVPAGRNDTLPLLLVGVRVPSNALLETRHQLSKLTEVGFLSTYTPKGQIYQLEKHLCPAKNH